MNKNDKRPIIQANGYNGSEPTRVCPKCGKKKPISEFGYRKMGDGYKNVTTIRKRIL